MPGLIRSEEENARQRALLKRMVPDIDASKFAVYNEGYWAYPWGSLTAKERKIMKAAGYTYYGRCWSKTRPRPLE